MDCRKYLLHHLAGEVEARAAESRLNLNAQQRRNNYPFTVNEYGYDVPSSSQLKN